MLTASVHFATGKSLFKHWYDRNDTPTRPKDEKGPARRGPSRATVSETPDTPAAREKGVRGGTHAASDCRRAEPRRTEPGYVGINFLFII